MCEKSTAQVKSMFLLENRFPDFTGCLSEKILREIWKMRKAWVIDILSTNDCLFHLLKKYAPDIPPLPPLLQKGPFILPPKEKKELLNLFTNDSMFCLESSETSIFFSFYVERNKTPNWCKTLFLPYAFKMLGFPLPFYLSDATFIEAVRDDAKADRLLENTYYPYVFLFQLLESVHHTIGKFFSVTIRKREFCALDESCSNFTEFHSTIQYYKACIDEIFAYFSNIASEAEKYLSVFDSKKWKTEKKALSRALYLNCNGSYFVNSKEYYEDAIFALKKGLGSHVPTMTVDILAKITSRITPPLAESDKKHMEEEVALVESGGIDQADSIFASLLLPTLQGNFVPTYGDFDKFSPMPYSFECIRNFCQGKYSLTEPIECDIIENAAEEQEEEPEEAEVKKISEKQSKNVAQKKKKRSRKIKGVCVVEKKSEFFPYLPTNAKKHPLTMDPIKCLFSLLCNGRYLDAYLYANSVFSKEENCLLCEAIALGLHVHPTHTKTLQRIREIAASVSSVPRESVLFYAPAFLRATLFDPCNAYANLWALLRAYSGELSWIEDVVSHIAMGNPFSLSSGQNGDLATRTMETLELLGRKTFDYLPATLIIASVYKKSGVLGKPLFEACQGNLKNIPNAAKFADINFCMKYLKKQNSKIFFKLENATRIELAKSLRQGGLLALEWTSDEPQNAVSQFSLESFKEKVFATVDKSRLEYTFFKQTLDFEKFSDTEPVIEKSVHPYLVPGVNPETLEIFDYRYFEDEEKHDVKKVLEDHVRRGHIKTLKTLVGLSPMYAETSVCINRHEMPLQAAIGMAENAWGNLYTARKHRISLLLYLSWLTNNRDRGEILKHLHEIRNLEAPTRKDILGYRDVIGSFCLRPSNDDEQTAQRRLEYYDALADFKDRQGEDDLTDGEYRAFQNFLSVFGIVRPQIIVQAVYDTGENKSFICFVQAPISSLEGWKNFRIALAFGASNDFLKKLQYQFADKPFMVLDFTDNSHYFPVMYERKGDCMYFDREMYGMYVS